MKARLHLNYNKAFNWYEKDAFFFKGYFFYEDDFFEKESAVAFLKKQSNLKFFLKKINGVFTLVKKEENRIIVITDITRSFPIFYSKINSIWFISDDINYIKQNKSNSTINEQAEWQFLASNHVHGSQTLLEEVHQTQSSEYISFTENSIEEQYFYFSYSCEDENESPKEKLIKECEVAFENSFKRNLNSCNDRQIVIPLSSGLDSRLIAVFLKKYNYKNVISYTYGKKDSFEIKYSKKTAEVLNFKWYFIEYNEHLIDHFLENNDFLEYVNFAAKYASMPNLQEYFAVNYLKENNLIQEDAIFFPGYAGDILGGSEYKKYENLNIKKNKLEEVLFQNKMTNKLFSNLEKKITLKKIKNNIKNFDINYQKQIPETVIDDYNLKERIAKYIFNSTSFYTFFNYEFRVPFWDLELLTFFKTLPITYKKNKSFYNIFLKENYFKPYQVDFETENHQAKNKFKKVKTIFKPFLPKFIKQKLLDKRDWNNYKAVTKPMLNHLKKHQVKIKRTFNDYNEIITQWYLFDIKNKS